MAHHRDTPANRIAGADSSACADRVIAIDWSGRRDHAEQSIWLADVRGGENGSVEALENGRTRSEVIDFLCGVGGGTGTVVVGLDFSFAFPAWFGRSLGCTSGTEVWGAAISEGERWLTECPAPFWGRPGHPKPRQFEHFRRCESAIRQPGVQPKSTFQIGGAGSVGTGSVRGMALLPRLREAGWSVWPFDPPGRLTAFEMYPRLFTGRVNKSSSSARLDYLRRLFRTPHGLPSTADCFLDAGIGSEDAFDALVSALSISRQVMAGHIDTVPGTPLPGDLPSFFERPTAIDGLAPHAIAPTLALEGWIPGDRVDLAARATRANVARDAPSWWS